MRNELIRKHLAAAVLAFATGGAHAAPAPAVTVYDATQLALGDFTVVERIGIGGWRSAFGVPGHATEEAARNAVIDRAAAVQADGIINLKCMSQTDGLVKSSGYYCYANAIRLTKRSGARQP